MRHLIVATAILAAASSASAETRPAKAQAAKPQSGTTATSTATATGDAMAPPLTKTVAVEAGDSAMVRAAKRAVASDRKSTRLNSSHVEISYAVFCLKKKR